MAQGNLITAVGRRKTAVARVLLQQGNGQITVNGKPLNTALPRATLQYIATQPFRAVGGARWSVGEAQRAALAGRGGGAVTAGVRPEDLRTAAQGHAATLELVEPLGSETLLHWKSAAGDHISRAGGGEMPAVGTRATLEPRADGVLLFEPATGASLLPAAAGAAAGR